MKRLFSLFIILCACAAGARAQEGPVSFEYEPQVDSSLVNVDVCGSMPSGVTLTQPRTVQEALSRQISANEGKQYSGFRIRIYYNSVQTAREVSQATADKFSAMFPDIPVYRSYASPNFKVSVGNFRSRIDAEVVLNSIKGEFPDATIIREYFKYPSIGRRNVEITETESPDIL